MRMISIAGAFAVATMALGADPVAAGSREFSASLARVPEIVSADAHGQAKLKLSSDGSELHYQLTAENLESFSQAHIHLSRAALEQQGLLDRLREPSQKRGHGPIVLFLTEFRREGTIADGVLTKGVATESDLVGPLKGYPLSLLVEFMEKRDTYIAVHVVQKMSSNKTFCCPVGLRGTIKARSPQ